MMQLTFCIVFTEKAAERLKENDLLRRKRFLRWPSTSAFRALSSALKTHPSSQMLFRQVPRPTAEGTRSSHLCS